MTYLKDYYKPPRGQKWQILRQNKAHSEQPSTVTRERIGSSPSSSRRNESLESDTPSARPVERAGSRASLGQTSRPVPTATPRTSTSPNSKFLQLSWRKCPFGHLSGRFFYKKGLDKSSPHRLSITFYFSLSPLSFLYYFGFFYTNLRPRFQCNPISSSNLTS